MSVYGSPTFKNNDSIHEYKESSSSSDSDDDKHHQKTSFSLNKKKKKGLFGRTVPVHACFGGGTTADIILWRNKIVSGGILAGVTVLWLLFEGMDYHLLTFICHCLMLSLLLLFLGSYVAPFLNRTPPTLPEAILPEKLFLSMTLALRREINKAYDTFRTMASGRDLKKFVKVMLGLWLISVIGNWFSFLTLIYIVFLLLCSLPVLYEKYEDQVDDAAKKAMAEINKYYMVLDSKVLRKIPGCPFSDKNKKLK